MTTNSTIMQGILGIFYAITLGVFTWVGHSLYQITIKLPVIEQQLASLTLQITDLSAFKQQGARFTAQDGLTLAQFVQSLQTRLTVVESDVTHLKEDELHEEHRKK